MTLAERACAYAVAFARYPASHLRVVREQGGDVLYGTWLLGNDYRVRSAYYGGYPKGYLERVQALFPYEGRVLHVFSGALPYGSYERCDLRQEAEYQCDVLDLPEHENRNGHQWKLVLADPPYSAEDATRYGTPMIDRKRVMSALAQVTRVGGHLVWLDCVWPMFKKTEWRTVGRICLIRSTNHRVRLISIFEREA